MGALSKSSGGGESARGTECPVEFTMVETFISVVLSMMMSSFSGKMRGKLRLKSGEAVRTGERWGWEGLAGQSCGGSAADFRGVGDFAFVHLLR